jgi:hypothetical protein
MWKVEIEAKQKQKKTIFGHALSVGIKTEPGDFLP